MVVTKGNLMELTFTEIVKLIHPDSNPDIIDASDKMTIVVRNRGDKKALWNLAVRWKLVLGVENGDTVVNVGQTTININTSGWDTGERYDFEAEMRERIRRQAEINQRIFEEMRQRIFESRRQHQQDMNYSGWEVPDEVNEWTT